MEERKQIHIEVRDKVATLKSMNFQLVGGNSDYEVVFDFDADWDEHIVKTALFTFGDTTVAKPFSGSVCEGVAVSNATLCYIGVFSGDIVTSTAALVEVGLSARDIGDVPEPPSEDVYNQIITLINEKLGGGGGGGVSPTIAVTPIEGGHRVAITDVNGTQTFDVMDGKEYELTDADKGDIVNRVLAALPNGDEVRY